MRIHPTLFLPILLTAACSVRTAPAPAQGGRFPSDDSIRAMLADIVPDARVGGAVVAMIELGGRRRIVAYGSATPGGPPLDGGSVFEIGSVTKAFTGVLLADMARRGEVALDEPLQRLLPGVQVPSWSGREITLADVATHTSGLPAMPPNFPKPENAAAYSAYTADELLASLSGYTLPRSPGTRYEYSNFVALLAHALALRGGKPYEALLRERVLAPLGMRHTGILITPEMRGRMTRGSTGTGDAAPYFVAPAFDGSGGLRSTADDMLRFAAANLAPPTGGLGEALRESRRGRFGPFNEDGDLAALGWAADERGAAGLSGGTFGYGAYLYVNPSEHRAVVVLANIAGREASLLGAHLSHPSQVPRPRASIARLVIAAYRARGLDAAVQRYRAARDGIGADASQLNTVGYWLLSRDAVEDAIAIFRLNTGEHPREPNPHDSLGEAYLKAGRIGEAVSSFSRAVSLAEARRDPQAESYRAHLAEAVRMSSP
ncbi:MAG TPA: serine hydrolase [Longimicrobium sp.]